MAASKGRVTTRTLTDMARKGERITMLTAYDYPTAAIVDAAGIDIVLVGDSLSMVVQGHETTLPVTMEQMLYHAELVGRAVQRAMVVVDLPFPEGQLDIGRSVEQGARVLKETACQAIKLEGGSEQAGRIAAMVSAGIPVMAHVGLRPQNVHVTGGYRAERDEEKLLQDARSAVDAGAFSVLIECVPAAIAGKITDSIDVPTIGIGAGKEVSGQVLVINDLIGLTQGYLPRFVRQYAQIGDEIDKAVRQYIDDVRGESFPGQEHQF